MKKLFTRAVTGFIFVAIIIIAINYNIPPLYLLFSAFSLLCAIEVVKIITAISNGFARAIYLLISVFIYCLLPFFLLYQSAFLEMGNHEYKSELLLSFFILLWANDTGAYLIGSAIGKHKLIERISPKKTWEGLAGGIIIAIVSAIIISKFFSILNLQEWIIASLVISVFGIIGDLFESYLKRRASIKDSGKMLPGHGGFLDRFDAMLFAAPAYYLFLRFFIF